MNRTEKIIHKGCSELAEAQKWGLFVKHSHRCYLDTPSVIDLYIYKKKRFCFEHKPNATCSIKQVCL